MSPTPEQIAAGHAFYTRRTLAVYDVAILGFFSPVAWRSPAARIVAHYDQHASGSHLDVGVGTGYFLDHCTFPNACPCPATQLRFDVNGRVHLLETRSDM